jgi:hypothetical protein
VDFAEAIRAHHINSLAEWAHRHAEPPLPIPGDRDLLVQLILDHADSGLSHRDVTWWQAHGDGFHWWRKILGPNRDAWQEATCIDFQMVA